MRIGPETDSDDYSSTYMRSDIVSLACSVDLEECTNVVKAQFQDSMMRHGDHHGNR